MNRDHQITETAINMVSEGTRLEGTLLFEHVSRIHGTLVGEVNARAGSTLILSETGIVEGVIHGDVVMIDGYVRGDILARTRVVVSPTGRVIGNIKTPSLKLEFGSHFEGRCFMENIGDLADELAKIDRPLKPA